MALTRTEQDMTGYTEVTFAEGVHHQLYLLLFVAALCLAAFVLISALRGSYAYLLFLPLLLVPLGLSAVIHYFQKCDSCKTRLTIYVNSDRTTELARYYFHVCEKCKTYSRYSFWADVG
jgi:hypothetical protein